MSSKVATATVSIVPKQLTPWAKGQSGNPAGRPKGSRNALGEDFLSAMQADFKANGESVIEKVRKDRPHEYLKIVASILPKEINVRTTAVEEMSDDDLALAVAALQSILAAQTAGTRSDEATQH